eukprot:UN01057
MPSRNKNKRRKSKKQSPHKPKEDPTESAQKDPESNPTGIDLQAAAAAAGVDLNNVDTNQLLQDAANMMQGGGMPGGGDDDGQAHKLNKQEKKARKTIQKLGMKLQKGFTRV